MNTSTSSRVVKPEELEIVKDLYVNQRKSMYEIAAVLGHNVSWVFLRMKRAGVQSRDAHESKSIYSVDEDYFCKIDSHEKAQIYGFLRADGCIHFCNKTDSIRLEVGLNDKDSDYLEWMKKCFGYTGPVTKYKPKIQKTINENSYAQLHISNYTFTTVLHRLGMKPRKSLVDIFPSFDEVPEEFLSSFVCGFFEGDGSAIINRKGNHPLFVISFAISYNFALPLQRYMREKLGINSCLYCKPAERTMNPSAHLWKLTTEGNPQALRLMEWMYSKATYRMQRKYDRYLEVRKLYDDNLELIKTDEWYDRKNQNISKGLMGHEVSAETRQKIGERQKAHARKTYRELKLRSPTGQYYLTKEYEALLKEFPELSMDGLCRLRAGRYASWKGWTKASDADIEAARTAGTLIEKAY
jgi:hypothetical protein